MLSITQGQNPIVEIISNSVCKARNVMDSKKVIPTLRSKSVVPANKQSLVMIQAIVTHDGVTFILNACCIDGD